MDCFIRNVPKEEKKSIVVVHHKETDAVYLYISGAPKPNLRIRIPPIRPEDVEMTPPVFLKKPGKRGYCAM